MQTLEVSLSVPVPEGMTLINSIELKELKETVSKGSVKNLKWFQDKLGIYSHDDIREVVLIPYRDELDIEFGGCVVYPERSGQPYKFLQNKTEEWIEQNFHKINWRRK